MKLPQLAPMDVSEGNADLTAPAAADFRARKSSLPLPGRFSALLAFVLRLRRLAVGIL